MKLLRDLQRKLILNLLKIKIRLLTQAFLDTLHIINKQVLILQNEIIFEKII
jgi:hypothetical protein